MTSGSLKFIFRNKEAAKAAEAQQDNRPKPEIVNATGDAPVFRADGIQLYGLDAELERKVCELEN